MTVPQKGKVFRHEFLLGETFLQSPVGVAKGCFGLTSPFKYMGFPGGSAIKNPLANAGHSGLMPGSGRSPGASENESESLSLVSDSLQPMDCNQPGFFVHGNFPGKNTGVGSHSLRQGDLPNPGIKLRSSALQAESLPSELPGKPTNTGVGSLSLLQGIFLTQELNQSFLHCRHILYQLSYQGKPIPET